MTLAPAAGGSADADGTGADGTGEPARCAWAGTSAAMRAYHDTEWGVPHHDDRALFELLSLEGAQAGLSWRTILDRRAAYRAAYHGFAIDRVAAMTEAELDHVLHHGGVVRHRGKVASVRDNARAAQALIAAEGSLDGWLWSFVDGAPIVTRHRESGFRAGAHRAVRPVEPGAARARLPLRRPDDLLRVHAGGRPGGRPSGGLLPGRRRGAAGLPIAPLAIAPLAIAPLATGHRGAGRRSPVRRS